MRLARLKREYPRPLEAYDEITLHRLSASLRDEMLTFAHALDEEDLLFLRVDITQRDEVDAIIAGQDGDRKVTILALDGEDAVVGYASLNRDDLAWTRHLAEIRVIVSPSYRGKGLGSLMARELAAVARDLGLVKVVARMPRVQIGAQEMFRKMGFNAEALLADWVIDRSGKTHDLVVMAHDVTSLV